MNGVDASEFRSSVYLNDGKRLFRVIDTVQADGDKEALVWLEDCATLAVERFTVKSLLKRRLSRTIPLAP